MKAVVLGCKDYPAFKHARDVGGIETFCNDVLPRLNNIEFLLFTRYYPGSRKYERINNVKIHRTPFINLPLLKTFTFNLFSFFEALKHKPDFIWAHEPIAGFFAYLINRVKKTPYILHIHSRGSKEPGSIIRKKGLNLMEKFAYKNAKKTIFVSSAISRELNKRGIVIPVGVDASKFKKTKMDRSLLLVNGKKICYIGRLESVKGLNYLIRAFSLIRKSKSKLLIIGSGSEKKNLQGLVKKLKLENDVYFLGYKSSRNILPFIDVFVLPSLSEGMPHTILEAISCKKPVVATSVGDVPKLVKHYLVNPRDISGLAKLIEKAIKEKKLEKLPKEYLIENVVKKIRTNLHDL